MVIKNYLQNKEMFLFFFNKKDAKRWILEMIRDKQFGVAGESL